MIGWHRVIYWKMDSLACSGYSGTCFYIIVTIRVCLSVCVLVCKCTYECTCKLCV